MLVGDDNLGVPQSISSSLHGIYSVALVGDDNLGVPP